MIQIHTSRTMNEERTLANEFKLMCKEYEYDGSIFSEDDKRMAALKYIINHRLSQVDRTIIILYADCGSYRKLGAKMGMSHMTIRTEVLRIKREILKLLKEQCKE